MKPTRLNLTSWKGMTAEFALGSLNYVRGLNGAGKSGILQALRFAIEGKTDQGNKPDAVAKYCGPSGGRVTLQLSDGFTFSRQVAVANTGAVSTSINGPGLHGSQKERTIKVAGKVGTCAPMFDLDAFLGGSVDMRRKYLLSLCGATGDVSGLGADLTERIGGDALLSMQESASERLNQARADKRAHQAALESHVTLDQDAASGLTGEQLDAKLREAQCSLDAIREAQAKVTARREARARLHRERTEIATALERATEPTPTVQPTQIADCDRRLKDITAAVDALRLPDIQARRDATIVANNKAMSDLESARRTLGDAQSKRDAARNRIDSLVSAEWHLLLDMLEELCGILQDDVEPMPKWRAIIELVRRNASADALERLNAELPALVAVAEEAAQQHHVAQTAYQAADAARKEAFRMVVDAATQADSSNHERSRLTLERDGLVRQRTRYAAWKRDRERFDTRRLQVESELAGLGDIDDSRVESLAAQHAELTADWDGLVKQRLTRERQSANAMTIERERKALADATVREACILAEVLEVKAMREEVLANTLAKFDGPMTNFVRWAFANEALHVRCLLADAKGSPACDIVIARDGADEHRHFEALSGGERVVVAAAITYALIQLEQPPMRLLLIEASEADADNLAGIARACGAGLAAGTIDAAYVATWTADAPLGDGWEIIDTGRRSDLVSVK